MIKIRNPHKALVIILFLMQNTSITTKSLYVPTRPSAKTKTTTKSLSMPTGPSAKTKK
jgi:hypothetical protein